MDDVLSAVSSLPASWQSTAALVLITLGLSSNLCSFASWALKAKLGVPSDQDSKLKRTLFRLVSVLDFIAVNTTKLADKKVQANLHDLVNKQAVKLGDVKAINESLEQTVREQAAAISASQRNLPPVRL